MTTTPLLATIGFLAMTGAAFAGPPKRIESWTSGQIARFDAAAQTVVIKQGTHEMTYQLAHDAKVLVGGHTQPSTTLGADVGREVRVRYSTAGLRRVADRLEVGSAPAAPAAAAAKAITPVKK